MNHVELARTRLFWQYEKSPNIAGVLDSIVEQIQDIEDATHPLYQRLLISRMYGVQLDLIGELVAQPRYGLIDALYRIRLTAKIAVNSSTGIRNNIINFMRIIAAGRTGNIRIIESYPASFQVSTDIVYTTSELTFIKSSIILIKPLGVRFNGLIIEPPSGLIFAYDNEGLPAPGTAGYGDETNSTVGGQYTDIF